MDRPIPGFYYDKEKKRYFKIVGSGNVAPASAAYNADNVKKRKMDEQEAERARKRHDETRHLIKRAPVLRDPVTGGWLVREFGVVDPELPVAGWASGLRDKGGIDFAPWPAGRRGPAITRMIVNGDDTGSGMGVVYASTTDDLIAGSYIPTDHKDRINFDNDPQMRPSRLYRIRREHVYITSISSLSYHKPSNTVIMTDNCLDDQANGSAHPLATGIVAFSPKLARRSDDDDMDVDHQDADTASHHGSLPPDPSNRPLGGEPRWILGECELYSKFGLHGHALTVNSVRAAPASHPDSWVLLATNRGLFEFGMDAAHQVHGPRAIDITGPHHHTTREDVLSADFHPTNPNIVFAGRRDGKFFRVDRRVAHHNNTMVGQHTGWGGNTRFRMAHAQYQGPSSIAHIRALDEHQLLAAGPTSAMAVYDVRWMKTTAVAAAEAADSSLSNYSEVNTGGKRRRKGARGKWSQPPPQSQSSFSSSSSSSSSSTTTPVVRMYEYTNMAHIHIGLDVAMGIGGGTGGGVVAAGQDDGTVGLFSVRTGRKLAAGDVDRIRLLPYEYQDVVKAVEFATMPWERGPSLFVGVGGVVKKYSFATGEEEDDD